MFKIAQALLICAFCVCNVLNAIVIDGLTADWVGVETILEDSEGDQGSFGPDIIEVRLTNDGYNLYALLAFSSPVDLRDTGIRMRIDADNNPLTGIAENGRGMDFTWEFMDNRGTSTLTSRDDIGRGNLVERIAPDGPSVIHEFAVSLEALPAVAAGEPVHLSFSADQGGDRIPEIGSSLSFTVSGPVAVQPLPIEAKRDPGLIRVVSWNVLRDAPFENNNEEAFIRILKALQPDIFMLQEVYDTSSEVIRQIFEDNLQTRPGEQWQFARQQDCITLSRFPILGYWSSDGNLVSRHETAEYIGSNLLIGNAHFPCCDNESGRIRESFNILSVIEARLDEAQPVGEAIIIGGDLNSGGIAPELINLTTGRVPLEMSSPRHLYEYDQYTWGSRGSFWGSSRLDFLLFDPATIFRHKAFVLDTDMLPPEALDDLKLQRNDTFISDHLPLVLDLRSPNLPEGLDADPMAVDGSTESEWFGMLNGFHYPDIEHESLGWIRMYEEGSDYWIRPTEGPWLWTGPTSYPWVYFPKFGR